MEEKLDKLLKRQSALIGAIILLAAALVMCWSTVNGLGNRLSQMQNTVGQMDGKTQREIQNGLAQMQNILDQQASMLADGRIVIGGLVTEGEQLATTVNLAVVPKQVTPGAVVTVRLLDDSYPNWSMTLPTQLAEDGLTYTASASIPLINQLRVQMVVEKNGVKTVEYLPWYEPVQERFLMGVNFTRSGNSSYNSNGEYIWKMTYSVDCYDKFYDNTPDQYPVSGKLAIQKNGETVQEYPIQFQRNRNNSYGELEVNTKLKADKGDQVEFVVEIQDNQGFTYRQVYLEGQESASVWNSQEGNSVTYQGKPLTTGLE